MYDYFMQRIKRARSFHANVGEGGGRAGDILFRARVNFELISPLNGSSFSSLDGLTR